MIKPFMSCNCMIPILIDYTYKKPNPLPCNKSTLEEESVPDGSLFLLPANKNVSLFVNIL